MRLVHLPDREGPGRIGIPPVQPNPDIDGDDVALCQLPAEAGNSVNHLFVYGSADTPGKSVQSLEGRDGTLVGAR